MSTKDDLVAEISELKAENIVLRNALKKIKSLDVNTNAASLETDYCVIMDTAEQALTSERSKE